MTASAATISDLKLALAALETRAQGTRQFDFIDTGAIFEPLPEARWLIPELQLGPGRPSMIAGYGASGKTLAAQSLAVSVATGKSVWSEFTTGEAVTVLHVDHEMGRDATIRRYQRLCTGLKITREELGDRIRVAPFPPIYLTDEDAKDSYTRSCEDVGLCLIDAFRGAVPGADENDSKVRRYLDLLALVSEKTGTTFLVLHHAGKPKTDSSSDGRTKARGSSGIFDACGAYFNLIGAKGEPKMVDHQKAHPSADGSLLDTFSIEFIDTQGETGSGVRVECRTKEQVAPQKGNQRAALEAAIRSAVDSCGATGAAGKSAVRVLVGKKAADVSGAVDQMLATGALENRGDRQHPRYFTNSSLRP